MKQKSRRIAALTGAMIVLMQGFNQPNTVFAEAQQYLRGDMDQNGVLDARDLTLMKRNLMNGMDAMKSNIADVTADGIADITDAEMLRDYLLAKITAFPEM